MSTPLPRRRIPADHLSLSAPARRVSPDHPDLLFLFACPASLPPLSHLQISLALTHSFGVNVSVLGCLSLGECLAADCLLAPDPAAWPRCPTSPISSATVYGLPNIGGPVEVTVKRVTEQLQGDRQKEAHGWLVEEGRALLAVNSPFVMGVVGVGVTDHDSVECLLLRHFEHGDLRSYLLSHAGDPSNGHPHSVSVSRRVRHPSSAPPSAHPPLPYPFPLIGIGIWLCSVFDVVSSGPSLQPLSIHSLHPPLTLRGGKTVDGAVGHGVACVSVLVSHFADVSLGLSSISTPKFTILI